MKKECTYCRYARQNSNGNWYCTLIKCIVKEVGESND